jgi:hypothetical protein
MDPVENIINKMDGLRQECSPDRVPEADRMMIFHVCKKLAIVVGLNSREREWLESLGATFSK